MARQIKTADDQIPEIVEDQASIRIGSVTWNEADHEGCNWSVNFVSGDTPSTYMRHIRDVIFKHRQQFNIPDPDR